MNIFAKRPLSLILCIILCGFSLFAIGNIYLKALILVFGMLFLILSLFHSFFRKKIFLISSIALLISVLFSFLYFDVFFFPTSSYGKEITLTGTVIDYEETSDYSKSVDLRLTAIDGEPASFKIKLYLYGSSEIQSGNVISVTSELSSLQSNESFDFKTYYASRGFSGSCNASEYTLIDKGTPPLSYKFKEIRKNILLRASDMTDADTGGLFAALLLGDRDNIPSQLELDFRRIGIIHVLSLGGMHLAILNSAIDKILYALRVHKKIRTVISCLFSLFFMLLTGFPITVLRAGIMLIISSFFTLISGNKDSITSMFIGATTVILIQPYAALDLGFWLSVLSTLGILTVSDFKLSYNADKEKPPQTVIGRIKDTVVISVAFSFFAMCASMLITSTSFDYISTLSVITTLLFSPFIEAFLILGILMLAVGNIIPIAPMVLFLNRCIVEISAAFSDLPFAYVSSEFLPVKILSFVICAMFASLLFLDVKKKRLYLSVMALLLISMLSLSAVMTHTAALDEGFTAASENEEDKILITSGGESLLFDCSSHKNSAGYSSVSFLSENHISELDCYTVANYSATLPDMLDVALSRIKISSVALPKPASEYEREIYSQTERIVAKYRTELFVYDNDGFVFGKYEIIPAYTDLDKAYSYLFATDSSIISYLTSGITDTLPYTNELLYVSDTVIFGDFGTGYSYTKTIDDWDSKLKTIVSFDKDIVFDISFAESVKTRIYTSVKRVKLK